MTSRVLCFHGYATSAEFMRFQLDHSRFRQNFEQLLELKELEGTHVIERPDEAPEMYKGPFRAWWRTKNGEKVVYEGWKESVERIEAAIMDDGPFDGLLGFSQGACLAATLIGLQSKGRCLTRHPPFKFAFLIAGFPPRDEELQEAYEESIACPSCHIIGEKDDIAEASRKLTDYFMNPIVVEHTGGHKIPRMTDAEIERIITFVKSTVSSPKL